MGNSNRRRTEEDMQLNPSSHYRETENNHLNPQRILHFIRDNDVQQRTAKGKEDANSFGEIKFEGFDKFKKKTAPYIRVADDTPVEILWKLMIEEWKIPKPKMIISLTGGARYFVGWNEDRLKILFNQGLVKTVIKTDAWIITGGSAAGLMQKLGKAISEERRLTEGGKKVIALGIADWNTTQNKEALANLSLNEGRWPAKYRKRDIEGRDLRFMPALDNNHTHFILVDGAKYAEESNSQDADNDKKSNSLDAKDAEESNSPDVEDDGESNSPDAENDKESSSRDVDDDKESKFPDINFRAKLERHIQSHDDAENSEQENAMIPVVLVVLGGGYGTIEIIHQALVQTHAEGPKVHSRPVVIVGGSGRAADIIVKALRLGSNDSFEGLKDDIRHILGGKESQVDDCVKLLKKISDHQNSKLVTVFQMDDANLNTIDEAILRAVLTLPDLAGEVQLDLAVSLNKCNIARDEILKPDKLSYWQEKVEFLKKKMFLTLRDNKADFVELLLSYLVDTDEFEEKEHLEKLYSEVVYGNISDADLITSTQQILKEKCGSNNQIEFKKVHDLLLELTKENKEYDEPDCSKKEDVLNISSPDKQLFLWAVLLNRRSLAILFWKRLETGNIGAALIASKILRGLAVYAEKKKDLRLQSSLKKNAKEFEDLAIHLLESCYEADTNRSGDLLVRTLPAWGNTTCLSVANSAECMNFLKCDCCQRKLHDVWMGNLLIYSWKQWLIFLVGIILPIFPFISFRGTGFPVAENKEDCSKQEGEKKGSYSNYFCRMKSDNPKTEKEVRRSGFAAEDVTFWEAMRYYYSAPITKFAYNVISYFTLLVLYAIFLLTDLKPSEEEGAPSIIEYVVIFWVCTLIVEELRQQLDQGFTIWWSDDWNRFDAGMYALFIVSIILRFSPPCGFAVARVTYSLTFILFSVRFLPFGFAYEGLGPKIIMIRRMMKDLVLFIYILMIFVAGFGIANEAILNPNKDLSFHLLVQSLYKPYWRLYGELLLDENEELAGQTNPTLIDFCPHADGHRRVATYLLAFYMLVSNILIVNLLIAMFSYTFQSVQDNAELYWKFYRFGLISEYHDRPTLAPPLIIFNHVYRLIMCLKKKTDVCGKQVKESSSLHMDLEKDDDALNVFEKKHLQNYFIKKTSNI